MTNKTSVEFETVEGIPYLYVVTWISGPTAAALGHFSELGPAKTFAERYQAWVITNRPDRYPPPLDVFSWEDLASRGLDNPTMEDTELIYGNGYGTWVCIDTLPVNPTLESVSTSKILLEEVGVETDVTD